MILRHVAYPLLLLSAVATVATALHLKLFLPLVNIGFVIGVFCYLAGLERVIPYEPAWHPEAWEWRRDVLYYLTTNATAVVARGAVAFIAIVVAPLGSRLPLWAELPAAILVLSFCSFFYHRVCHRNPWLWRAHGIHHVPGKVNVSNNNVNQLVDVLGHIFFTQLVLYLLGFSQSAVFAAMIFKAAQGYGVHANIDVRLGWLSYVLATPEQHRLHHGSDPREAGHYGADLPLWDLLFGSFTWRPNRVPAAVGVQDPASFPPASAFLASQAHPFRQSERPGGQPAGGPGVRQ